MARLRYNGLSATLGAALTAGDTTITFAGALTHSGGTAVPTISAGDYIPLALLDAAGALREIVNLTAYTTGATTGTITRAQESTTATTHETTGRIQNAFTTTDFGELESLIGGSNAPLFRGVWEPDSLAYAETFAGGSILTPFEVVVNSNGGATPTVVAGGSGGDYWAEVRGNNFHNLAYADLRLNLASLEISNITRVRANVSIGGGAPHNWRSSFRKNGVEVWAQNQGTLAWTAKETTADSDDVVTWRHAGIEGSTGTSDGYLRVSDIEVYAAAAPYMLGEYVTHMGRLWRSNADNNSGTPGTGGWTAVPIGYDTATTTAARPTGMSAGAHVFDTTIGKPVWWNGTGWVDATGTTA